MQIYLYTFATSHLKFARARAERHVIGTRGNSRLNKGQTFIKRSHRKTYQPAEARIYHSCVELTILIGKGQCASEIQLLNTPHDQLRCHHGKQMTPVWRSSISHAQSLTKTSTRIFATGVEATLMLAPEKTRWHGNGDYGCSRFKLWIAFDEQNIGCCGNNCGIML